ncbi:hypothetical protein AZE42_11352 [Rhizopogon vesiculosus]|uniref:Uncharacterized protein n=1 Tax=Rhizopogon vesiculosus TaxID=180088 RepID=A0A1J8Q7P8_9AGAM|nr:hypothetical protein AZE42_11352 [Rhizopogon vesiculosus]
MNEFAETYAVHIVSKGRSKVLPTIVAMIVILGSGVAIGKHWLVISLSAHHLI